MDNSCAIRVQFVCKNGRKMVCILRILIPYTGTKIRVINADIIIKWLKNS